MNGLIEVSANEMMEVDGGWICEANDVKGYNNYSPAGYPDMKPGELERVAAIAVGSAIAAKTGVAGAVIVGVILYQITK